MFLKGAVRLRRTTSRFVSKFERDGSPWVYSNELERADPALGPGAWAALESADGKVLAYGHYNPHSLIAFRVFERGAFRSEEQARALFLKRMDWALESRLRALGARIAAGESGRASFRLVFGESDAVPGLVVDLYETADGRGCAVAQCHSAGSDGFVSWLQQWLSERLAIGRGVLRRDLDSRKLECAELSVSEWGDVPAECFAFEGGLRFWVDPRRGQKTGFFYDLRDCRAELAARVAAMAAARARGGDGGGAPVTVLDCFSYVGAWGLQILRRSPQARLVALDVSEAALAQLRRNAEDNGLAGRVETVRADFFEEGIPPSCVPAGGFDAVVADPPALTSSARHASQGRKAHERCFSGVLAALAPGGVAALSSCSFHLSWDEFLGCVRRAAHARDRLLRLSHFGSQAADHPVLSSQTESRYLKCVIGDAVRG